MRKRSANLRGASIRYRGCCARESRRKTEEDLGRPGKTRLPPSRVMSKQRTECDD